LDVGWIPIRPAKGSSLPCREPSSPRIVSVDMKIFNPGNLAKYAIVYFPETYKEMGSAGGVALLHAQGRYLSSRGEPDPDWVFWTKMKAGFFRGPVAQPPDEPRAEPSTGATANRRQYAAGFL